MLNRFQYKTKEGVININTLSPNMEFYYRIQRLRSLNPSAFGAKIAFFSIDNELLYYNKNRYSHELRCLPNEISESISEESIHLVKWSSDGNIVYILEYYMSENFDTFIDLRKRIIISKKNHRYDSFIVPNSFSNDFLSQLMKKYEFKKERIKNDIFSENYFFNKWFPKV